MEESETLHPHTNNTEHGLPLERIGLMVAFNELKILSLQMFRLVR